MSETDSFIEEVSEEVRRDRLFAFFKKYAWVFAAIVVLIVGGTAVNGYLTARHQTEAEATGEALRVAQTAATAEAFAPIADSDAPAAVIAAMDEAAVLANDGKQDEAAALLDSIASDGNMPALYRDLALLKLVMLNGQNMQSDELFQALDKLAVPGAPFRLLAMEQRAIANLRAGNQEAAMSDLAQILVDQNATEGLRNRVQQLTIAVKGQLPAATSTDG